MPRPKSAKFLENVCLDNISDNLDKFGSSYSPDGRGISSSEDNSETRDDELSVFECLPSWLVVPILDVVAQKSDRTRLNKDHLALLITTGLEALDLRASPVIYGHYHANKYDDEIVVHLLRTAALRQSPLKFLRLCMRDQFARLINFKDQLPAFPNLIKLDVSDSSEENVNDDFLGILATCCLKLEELRLDFCKGVTDVGVQQLCGYHQDGTGDGVGRGCKSLVRLHVEGTGVTRHGARLALEHLPRLQVFDYHSTLQIAAEMNQTDGASQLNLVNLYVTRGDDRKVPYVQGSWIHAVRLCPLIVDVIISGMISSLVDSDLAALLNLNRLQKFTLECCKGISFDGGLLPILKTFGPSSLGTLRLSVVPEVNIRSIVEFCSKLQEIRLNDIERYSPSHPSGLRSSSPRHLPHLQHLTIEVSEDDFYPPFAPSNADLSLLISSSPALENLGLHFVHQMTDQIVEEAIVQHGFPKLKSFIVEQCRYVTNRVVDLLLELDNPLSLICFEMYGSHPNRDSFYDCWREKIRENNWDVQIRNCDNTERYWDL